MSETTPEQFASGIKYGQEPTSFTSVGNEAGRIQKREPLTAPTI
jgi:hypothetical protein